MIALAVAHAVLLFTIPTAPVIALGLWWNSNTISHNFIHRPFFVDAGPVLFAGYLSLLLDFPSRCGATAIWRTTRACTAACACSTELALESSLIVSLWSALAAAAPVFFISTYLPGYLAGLGLCALHGYYEHVHGATSHYGKLYNLLFFNDGYHCRAPRASRGALDTSMEFCAPAARASAWPGTAALDGRVQPGDSRAVGTEVAVCKLFVLRTHARAFRELAGAPPPVERVAIIGGGLFLALP